MAPTDEAQASDKIRAVTIAPLLEARKDGYKVGTLQATPAGYSLYERIGFRHYCDIAT